MFHLPSSAMISEGNRHRHRRRYRQAILFPLLEEKIFFIHQIHLPCLPLFLQIITDIRQ